MSSLVPTTLEQGHWVAQVPGPCGGGGWGLALRPGVLVRNPQGSVRETEAQGQDPPGDT